MTERARSMWSIETKSPRGMMYHDETQTRRVESGFFLSCEMYVTRLQGNIQPLNRYCYRLYHPGFPLLQISTSSSSDIHFFLLPHAG